MWRGWVVFLLVVASWAGTPPEGSLVVAWDGGTLVLAPEPGHVGQAEVLLGQDLHVEFTQRGELPDIVKVETNGGVVAFSMYGHSNGPQWQLHGGASETEGAFFSAAIGVDGDETRRAAVLPAGRYRVSVFGELPGVSLKIVLGQRDGFVRVPLSRGEGGLVRADLNPALPLGADAEVLSVGGQHAGVSIPASGTELAIAWGSWATLQGPGSGRQWHCLEVGEVSSDHCRDVPNRQGRFDTSLEGETTIWMFSAVSSVADDRQVAGLSFDLNGRANDASGYVAWFESPFAPEP